MAKWKNYRGVIEAIDGDKASMTVYYPRNEPKWAVDVSMQDIINRGIEYRVGAVVAIRFQKLSKGCLVQLIGEIKPAIPSQEEISLEEQRINEIFS